MELSRNWHWMWSTFYFHKKYNGFCYAIHKVFSGKFLSAILKTLFYLIIFNKKKKKFIFKEHQDYSIL